VPTVPRRHRGGAGAFTGEVARIAMRPRWSELEEAGRGAEEETTAVVRHRGCVHGPRRPPRPRRASVN
jgi:hypothetical protein